MLRKDRRNVRICYRITFHRLLAQLPICCVRKPRRRAADIVLSCIHLHKEDGYFSAMTLHPNEEGVMAYLSHEQYEKELADMGPVRNQRGTPLIEYHF